MDLNSKERLRTSVLLLIMSRVICIKGLSHNLNCVTDYVSTINCTLQTNLTTDLPKWLKLENSGYLRCPLHRDDDRFYCSVKQDVFADTDEYNIFLCYEENKCLPKPLDEEFYPFKNIKPNPPCCLTLMQNSSQLHFYWESTYEKEIKYTDLPTELTYQLHFYQSGQFNGFQHDVFVDETTCTIQDDVFKPGAEYVAQVRTSPNRSGSVEAHYEGQWSDWSNKVHWRIPPKVDEKNLQAFNLKNLLIPVGVVVLIFLSLCFTSVKKWKQKVFIPTPEPYFHALYADCQGDFKSWVIMEKTVDLPLTEKSSHIEKIFECEDIQEAAPSLPQGREYANMSGSECALPEPGLPSPASTSGLDSATASCTSVCLSPESRSPTGEDSGCWLNSDQSLEQSHSWYCNDYCTLSTFHQSAFGTAGRSLKCDTCMIMRHDATEETHICE